ncbi:MAG: hypothetical protein M5U34_07755 [Chloroflexi bacterium]|nr:hypothetical protein [Chloroflexota bacterium]
MGHRDVYGGMNTICPGGSMQDLLPWLRTPDCQSPGSGFALHLCQRRKRRLHQSQCPLV